MAISHHAATFTKIFKILLNIVVVCLIRYGDGGYYLGASNNKSKDAEAFVSGVAIGYLIYTSVALVSIFLNRKSHDSTITDCLMNFIGAILWLTVGGLVIQFWIRFDPGNHFQISNPKKAGIAAGVISIINAVVYLGETFISYKNYVDDGGSGQY